MQKAVKMLKAEEENFRKCANEQNIYDFEKEIDPMGYSDSSLYIYMNIIFLLFVGIYLRSQVSVYRAIGPLVDSVCEIIVITLSQMYAFIVLYFCFSIDQLFKITVLSGYCDLLNQITNSPSEKIISVYSAVTPIVMPSVIYDI